MFQTLSKKKQLQIVDRRQRMLLRTVRGEGRRGPRRRRIRQGEPHDPVRRLSRQVGDQALELGSSVGVRSSTCRRVRSTF